MVAIARNLPEVNANPSTFTLPTVNSSQTITYATGAPTNELYLSDDPRAAFRGGSSYVASATSYSNNNAFPVGSVTLFRNSGPDADGLQSLPDTFRGLTNAFMTNHLARATNANGFASIGELGYLWAGKPWQTLSMTRTNNPTTADWNLLDYISGGYTNGSTNFTSMPILPVARTGLGVTAINSLVQDGGFNVLTRKRATAEAFFANASGLKAAAVSDYISATRPELASVGGALAALSNLSSSTTTKFASEAIVRAAANAAVTQSRVFTFYSRGEHISANSRSEATLEAEVFVDVDSQTGAPVVRVISKKFL